MLSQLCSHGLIGFESVLCCKQTLLLLAVFSGVLPPVVSDSVLVLICGGFCAQVKSASEWVVDKLVSSQETLTKFVVFAHHKTVLDLLQEASYSIFVFVFIRA